MDIEKNLKNPPKKYRPIPFWSWNERLDAEETRRQIEMMDENGLGGYFMHARGGLETEYMGEEWFENTDVGVEEGEKRGMGAWAYDENGWPSGFAGGAVNGLGEVYQQKYLRMEKGEANGERTITNFNGYHFYYDVNPFYVDTLDKKVIKEFIRAAYEPYQKRYGKRMPGVFTDEPQISRDGIPWSLVMPEEYEKRYNDNLLEHLEELFLPVHDYKTTRVRFWKMVTDLFTESFAKQIFDFCEEHGMKLTGHMVLEETMKSQLTSNGAIMPNYEYFHIPGMDWLCRLKMIPQTALQVASVAHQLGKKQILSETFALCGHNVSFEELRRMYEGQMVRGINLLCPHLQGYSLRGIRKRDYPPAMYYQQPWWEEYKIFIDAMSRIGMLLTEGKPEFDTLLIHPQTTAWSLFDNDKNEGLDRLQAEFDNAINALEQKHCLFHLGDETILSRHARVEGRTIVVGNQRYDKIIKPVGDMLLDSTKALLAEFEANGGRLISVEDIKPNTVIDNPSVTYTMRRFDNFTMHYFVNETEEIQNAKIGVGGKKLDIKTGDMVDFDSNYTFAPMDSLVVLDCGAASSSPEKKVLNNLPLSGDWDIVSAEPNALVLDTCDYWFDGELIEENAYVLDICDRANALMKRTAVKMRFTFETDFIPENIYLVCETPDRFDITLNGTAVDKTDCGYFRDSAFRKLDIAKLVKAGTNEIIMTCDFEQSEEVYRMIRNSQIFESEKNKLHYDMEIEGMFIIGDFAVKTDAAYDKLDKDAVRTNGGFIITKAPEKVTLRNLEQQGFAFFSGKLTVAKTITANGTDYQLAFKKKGLNAVHVKVNGEDAGTLLWNPYALDLSKYIKDGENRIELTLVNNLRNLLGPHHFAEGECYSVGPSTFYKNSSPFCPDGAPWNDGYCLVETSIE